MSAPHHAILWQSGTLNICWRHASLHRGWGDVLQQYSMKLAERSTVPWEGAYSQGVAVCGVQRKVASSSSWACAHLRCRPRLQESGEH